MQREMNITKLNMNVKPIVYLFKKLYNKRLVIKAKRVAKAPKPYKDQGSKPCFMIPPRITPPNVNLDISIINLAVSSSTFFLFSFIASVI